MSSFYIYIDYFNKFQTQLLHKHRVIEVPYGTAQQCSSHFSHQKENGFLSTVSAENKIFYPELEKHHLKKN